MGIVNDLLAVLRRPLSAPVEVDSPRKRGSVPAEKPVTEADLVDAIRRSHVERDVAEGVIATHGARREALLLQEGSDEAIAALDAEIASANLQLERLDRIEPDLHRRLAELREYERQQRWLALRDEYIALARQHLDPLRVFIAAAIDTAELRHRIQEEFPGAPLPVSPSFTTEAADGFAAGLDQLALISFNSHRTAPPIATSLQDLIRTGDSGGFPVVPHGARLISLRTTAPVEDWQDPDRLWPIGHILQMPPADAERLIRAGKAEMIGVQS